MKDLARRPSWIAVGPESNEKYEGKKKQEGKRATETQGRRPCEDRDGHCSDASASRAMPRTAGSPRSWEKHETDPPSLTNPEDSWPRELGESIFVLF